MMAQHYAFFFFFQCHAIHWGGSWWRAYKTYDQTAWCLMANTSGGVLEVFYFRSWGSRVDWRVRYRSMIYSHISVRSKFCYIAMSIKLHGRNNWHLWICNKIAEKCKKSVLTLKKIESREGFLNRKVATRSAKDYVGWDMNCAWHK